MNRTFGLITALLILSYTGGTDVCRAQQTTSTATVKDAKKIDQATLNSILEKNSQRFKLGKVADYIPELSKANAQSIALSVVNNDGTLVSAGDIHQKFTIQSISKIIALMIAVQENGEKAVFEKMGYFGTDKPFNHFGNLETMGKPLNPMMNAGAILTTALIKGNAEEPFAKILKMIRFITNNELIDYSHAVYNSERETGHRNRGMFYIMRNSGLIDGEGEEKLNNYFKQCSIEITVEDLAKIGYFFANHCVRYDGNKQFQDANLSQLIQSQMLIAGMYEFSGEYARTVGLPSKSGVGGGIVVSVPHSMGIGAFSPALDQHGNSLAGYHMILDLVKANHLSLFD
ncbi:MAG: glutaminase [Sphingobacterium sp.]|jgi:glutaminase|uniref:glutaminase A n=1 Tax=unclassified Sphingobacterium TaxID=2609468 RepID=UPI00098481E0|nr:glutaminase A [Sphingobacterium sp. CZ-UAM]MDF2515505.1 glutaminase [Sphingobacterium sp.]OOG19429.1 glutaminase A [Sphingobacterium sp. CZ-UAM]